MSSRIGRIEAADGGTPYLDEIGDLTLELQPKLLVFLHERIIQRIGSNRQRKVNAGPKTPRFSYGRQPAIDRRSGA